MIQWIASLQSLLIAAALVLTGVSKLRGFTAPETARRTAMARLVGEERAAVALRAVGAIEVAVAVAVLAHPFGAAASTLLAVGFLGYLGYARIAAPDAGCGCSAGKLERVTWRHFARAGMLLLVSGLALTAGQWWGAAVLLAPVGAAVTLLAESALFVTLSPEHDRRWLRPLRQLKVRLSHPLAGSASSREAPLLATIEQLQLSEAYRQVGSMITSDVVDSWDEGEWRILEYAARRADGYAGTMVFAVPRLRYDPDAVRATFLDGSRAESVTAPA